MKDINGLKIQIHDQVSMIGSDRGLVVCDLDNCQFTESFPEDEWEYMKVGIMVDSEKAGLMHFPTQDQVSTEQLTIIVDA